MNGRELRIGITCFPTLGGSGTIATEIGLGLGRRGHEVHFICYDVPARLRAAQTAEKGTFGLHFHKVEIADYPLPHLDLYTMALATRMFEVSREQRLDLLHVHYALPHATSAYFSRELLREAGAAMPRLITTLHGTDITFFGSARSVHAANRFALLRSDGLTAPSLFLKQTAYEKLGLPACLPFEVIPNFVDTERFRPPEVRKKDGPPVLIHSSNFRPLKRIEDVVRILALVRKKTPAMLLLIGDGPERPRMERLVQELALGDAVRFLGMKLDFSSLLRHADVFLLPSATEGFGLAALEALSSGVPVVASKIGGIPEVVADGETGFLCAPGDVVEMAAAVLRLLGDSALHARMSHAARASVLSRWQAEPTVGLYVDFYKRILNDTSTRQALS